MRSKIRKILVTGGAGFIGSAFVRQLVKHKYDVTVIDKLTYAADLRRLAEAKGSYRFYNSDISDDKNTDTIFKKENPEIVINFAAETHVDRSILDAGIFMKTNCMGVQILLDASRKFNIKKFIHISTDEVYGEIRKGKFKEGSPLKPNSPYAASKAAADLLIASYVRTHRFPAIIVRPSNNYGPWQYPEKLIPLAILKLIRGEKVPVYADGNNVREWLYVEDCAEGIFRILTKGKIGEIYNLGSNRQERNIEVVKRILKFLKKDKNNFEFVRDRPGHDFRYSLNSSKVIDGLGWRPKLNFETGLKLTVYWCLKHRGWLLSKWGNVSPLYK